MSISLNGSLITNCISINKLSGHVGIQCEPGLLGFRKIEVDVF